MAHLPRTTLLLLLATTALAATGCIRRTLTVKTDPPGALVYLNDEEMGRSPITVPFLFYGTYDVRLEKEGHATVQTEGVAQGPWWDLPIIDLLAEIGPDRHVDIHWHYRLPKTDGHSTQGLLERAETLRRKLSSP